PRRADRARRPQEPQRPGRRREHRDHHRLRARSPDDQAGEPERPRRRYPRLHGARADLRGPAGGDRRHLRRRHDRLRDAHRVAAALARADPLIAGHQAKLAVRELQAALAELAPAHDGAAPTPSSAWRIETVLAALYETLGKQQRARGMALAAYRHALETSCPL